LNDFSEFQKKSKPTQKQVDQVFQYMDRKNQGGINYSDFYKWAIKFNDDFKWKLIRNFFDSYSTEGENCLDSNDLSLFLEDLSKIYKIPKPNLLQVKNFFDSIDTDHSGKISYQEFVDWIESLEKKFKSKFDIKKLFNLFDDDGNGYLDEKELGHFLEDLLRRFNRPTPTDEQKHEMFKRLDSNNLGYITFDDFNEWYQEFMKLHQK
jgi:Ca2+-binding EF-hand superfamily protein